MKLFTSNIPSKKSTARGFTLIEILLASVAFAMIVLAIKVALMGSLELRKRGQARMDRLNVRHRVLEVMEKDLRQCLLTESVFAESFIGETMNGGILRTDQLEFYTASGIVYTNQPWGHLQKVRYYLDQAMDDGREERPEGWTLYREVTRNLLDSIQEIPVPQALAHRVASLAFQYFDGETWQDNWDSSVDASQLPVAVRFRIEFMQEEEPAGQRSSSTANDEALPVIQSTVALMAVPQIETEDQEDAEPLAEDP